MQKGTAGWKSWTKMEVAVEWLNAVDPWLLLQAKTWFIEHRIGMNKIFP